MPETEPETERIRCETLAKQDRALKGRTTRLLDAAKRAVEIAIEDSEAAALAYRTAANAPA